MKRTMKYLGCGLFAALLVVYIGGCIYFSRYFYYGTRINGVLCGCMSEDAVREMLLKRQEGYALQIEGREGLSDVLSGEEVGLAFEPREELHELLNRQRRYLWPLCFFEETEWTLQKSVSLDEEKFAAAFAGLSIVSSENIRYPENARLSVYSPWKKGYYVISEVEGNAPLLRYMKDAVREALLQGERELILTDDSFYHCPSVTAEDEDLNRLCEELNSYTSLVFDYQIPGGDAAVDGDEIHKWLKVENGAVVVDEELVKAFVQEIADTYGTYGAEWDFVTVDGRIKTLKNKRYGWKMDVEAEQAALLEMLREKKSTVHTPEWEQKGYAADTAGLGDTYVEIDLGAQHVYVIENGEVILETDCVSGDTSKGRTTPSGIFALRSKARNVVLRGQGYASPVSYWMPFNQGIGLHDATWRDSFGGDIYKTNGSHGCVNLPLSKAKEIYQFVEVGMPVVCYY